MASRLISTERLRWLIGGGIVLILLLSTFTFSVEEQHAALITRFGKPVRTIEQAGLHWKLPWPIDRAVDIDQRVRLFNSRHTEMLTKDKKNLILLSYAVWKVADPLKFVRSVGTTDAAESKLDGLITHAQIGVLGRHDLSALVSTDPTTLQIEQIEREILQAVRATAADSYGIEMSEIGMKRLSLPEANVERVFEQMRAERQRFATEYRAEGSREASRLRADADLEKAKILASAEEEAIRIRGDADAEAAGIYAEAHRTDPELYRFLRQLESLEKLMHSKSNVILRTDSEPFGMLKEKP